MNDLYLKILSCLMGNIMNTDVLKLLLLATALQLVSSTTTAATDIGRDIRGEATLEDGGYLELSLGTVTYDSALIGARNKDIVSFFINGRYQWNGMFIEAFSEGRIGTNLGYNFWNPGDWSLDAILSRKGQAFDFVKSDELKGLQASDRGADYLPGVRATRYIDDYSLQLTALGKSNRHYLSTFVGRHWQTRNWNLHTLLGAEYNSAAIVDRYYGVNEGEASELFSAYSAGAGTTLSMEVGVTYPISEDWVFRSTAKYLKLPDSVADSPITDQDSESMLSVNLSYIF